jgi:hypothetical protein
MTKIWLVTSLILYLSVSNPHWYQCGSRSTILGQCGSGCGSRSRALMTKSLKIFTTEFFYIKNYNLLILSPP